MEVMVPPLAPSCTVQVTAGLVALVRVAVNDWLLFTETVIDVGDRVIATCGVLLTVTVAVAFLSGFSTEVAVTWSDGAGWLRVLLALGSVLSLALVDRRWMVWILHKIPRTRDASSDLVPPQRAILLTFIASVVTIATLAVGYLIVLGSFGAVDDPWLVVGAFAIAWLVGFLLVPLPSGLGAREAVLVAILHGTFPSSVLVAASVYQRVVLIATEGLLALIASHRVRPSRLRSTTGDAVS